MLYRKCRGETFLPASVADYYFEIDPQSGMVTRQVETAAGQFLHGRWNGRELVGSISDQFFSELELMDPKLVHVSRKEFESVWTRALDAKRNEDDDNSPEKVD